SLLCAPCARRRDYRRQAGSFVRRKPVCERAKANPLRASRRSIQFIEPLIHKPELPVLRVVAIGNLKRSVVPPLGSRIDDDGVDGTLNRATPCIQMGGTNDAVRINV